MTAISVEGGQLISQQDQRCLDSEGNDSNLNQTSELASEDHGLELFKLNESANKSPELNAAQELPKVEKRKRRKSGRQRSTTSRDETLAFGVNSALLLFVPICICMTIVTLTVRNVEFYNSKSQQVGVTPFHTNDEDSVTLLWQSAANASIMLVGIVIMTIILLLLYKYRFYKTIHAWLVLSSVSLLFFVTYNYLRNLLEARNTPFDYITLALVMWNFGVGGLVCIHWKGPLLLQQAYLVVISSLVALMYIRILPEWTAWAILCGMIIWDLVAVLCPLGPLRLLVETASERNEQIFPALLYSSTVLWQITMADNAELKKTDAPDARDFNSEIPAASQAEIVFIEEGQSVSELKKPETDYLKKARKSKKSLKAVVVPLDIGSSDVDEQKRIQERPFFQEQFKTALRRMTTPVDRKDKEIIEFGTTIDPLKSILTPKNKIRMRKSLAPNKHSAVDGAEDEEDRPGAKLGLGDFIFYGVLVGKAASGDDWLAPITCCISILIGLCCTLLLLAVYQQALPALPISLTFGIFFYFTTTFFVRPFVDTLAYEQVYI